MAGVKVTLLRSTDMGLPAIRVFDNATYWVFADDHPGGTLNIMKQEGDAGATASPGDVKRTIIAEFPALGIESVEFV